MEDAIRHHQGLTYIETHGCPERVGYWVGRGASRQINLAVAMMCAGWPPGHPAELRLRLAPYRQALERHLPDAAAELRGMARGAGVPYDLLVAANAAEELEAGPGPRSGRAPGGGCSCVGLPPSTTADGRVLLGHNEDGGAGYEDTCYVVRAQPDQGPAYLAFTYAGLLLHQGLNASGIGQVGNALYFGDIQPFGTPKLPAYRAALGCASLEAAIRAAAAPWRAHGQNHLLAERSGIMCDVEVSATAWALWWAQGRPLVHTNHALDPGLAGLERGDRLNSKLRYARLAELAARDQGRHSVDTVSAMLRDHANYPKSVCKHLEPPANPEVRTIASVIVDLTAAELHVARGYPCQAGYQVFRL